MIIENVPLARDHRARKQVRTLLASGYSVCVISRRDPDNEPYRGEDGLTLYEYPPPPESGRQLSFAFEYLYCWVAAVVLAARAFWTVGFQAIQAGDPPDIHFLLAIPFKLAGRIFIVDQRDLSPEVFAERYGPDHKAILRVLRALERVSWRFADHVLCVNGSLRDVILERGGLPPASVTVVGNGPILAKASARTAHPDLKMGKRFLICWLGLMGPQDHVDLALRAVEHVVHGLGRTDCHFAFIGDGEALPDLRQRATRARLQDWVTFTGWLDQNASYDYLATADLAIDSNLQEEVTPVKGMEYMAFGVPLVAFDLRETRAMAQEAGAYVRPGDAVAMGIAIDALLDDPSRRAAMAESAGRRIEETLAWDRQAGPYVAVFERLLGYFGQPNVGSHS